ncbi:MAG TPA: hypothetical protein VIY86_04115, partial [Pirellulaceae bacterium]
EGFMVLSSLSMVAMRLCYHRGATITISQYGFGRSRDPRGGCVPRGFPTWPPSISNPRSIPTWTWRHERENN